MLLFRIAGALLVAAAGAIHLYLYFDYFHRVHVIGALFVVNAAAGFVIALTLLLWSSLWAILAGLAFAATTLGAFFLSVYHGLFGYVERLHGPWQEAAGGVELAAIVALLAAAGLDLSRRGVRAFPQTNMGAGAVRKTEPRGWPGGRTR